MNQISRENVLSSHYPERIVQFGKGNFLRGFFGWMVNKMNKKIGYDSGIVVVPTFTRSADSVLNQQDGLYTVRLTGTEKGAPVVSTDLVDAVTRSIDLYSEFEVFLEVARNPQIQLVVSNTTEAGIAYESGDKYLDRPPSSYPAKLTRFLHERFQFFAGSSESAVVVLPTELVENNADKLRTIVLQYARLWGLEEEFVNWVNVDCVFCNTLVDRIVTGYPADNIEEIWNELGYRDHLIVEGEQFHLWAISADKRAQAVFPADAAGLNVVYTDDLSIYQKRKVAILNGAHTIMTLIGLNYGLETVQEAVEHEVVGPYIDGTVFSEIVLTFGDQDKGRQYSEATLSRFRNPFIRHELSSISLNSVSKYKARVLPTLLEYHGRFSEPPFGLVLALAALIRLYRGTLRGKQVELKDSLDTIERIKSIWLSFDRGEIEHVTVVKGILEDHALWGMNLNDVAGVSELTAAMLQRIDHDDPADGLKELIKDHNWQVTK